MSDAALLAGRSLRSDAGWRAVVAAFALNGLLFGAWASRVPAFKEGFGLTPGTLGLLLLALAGGAIISFPFAGALSETWGAERLTIRCACAYAPALVLLALAPHAACLGPRALGFRRASRRDGRVDERMGRTGGDADPTQYDVRLPRDVQSRGWHRGGLRVCGPPVGTGANLALRPRRILRRGPDTGGDASRSERAHFEGWGREEAARRMAFANARAGRPHRVRRFDGRRGHG